MGARCLATYASHASWSLVVQGANTSLASRCGGKRAVCHTAGQAASRHPERLGASEIKACTALVVFHPTPELASRLHVYACNISDRIRSVLRTTAAQTTYTSFAPDKPRGNRTVEMELPTNESILRTFDDLVSDGVIVYAPYEVVEYDSESYPVSDSISRERL